MLKKRYLWMGKVLLLVFLAGGTGCARSYQSRYTVGLTRPSNAFPEGASLGITELKDARPLANVARDPAKCVVGTYGLHKFGITHKGQKFIGVGVLIQDLLVQELQGIGIDAHAVGSDEIVVEPGDLQKLAAQSKYDFVLGGKVLQFSFDYREGMITVTGMQTAALELSLVRPEGKPVFKNEVFMENNTENEGMGCLHSTSIDKLLTKALKKALQRVADRITEATASGTGEVASK